LADVVSHAPPGLRVETSVGVGSPWESICDAAEDKQAVVILVGSHGDSAVDRLLGTTAAKVVNHAECSVLVVRGAPSLHRNKP
jgi:nucleotide-binding universal stress UspA family protein